MTSLEKIRNELKNVKYYYSRQKMFEDHFKEFSSDAILYNVEKYKRALRSATPKMYDLFISLYVDNHTQKEVAEIMNYSSEYIRILNSKLLKFLQSELSGEGDKDGKGK